MKLHEKPDEFRILVELTSQELDIRQVYIEKDYWVTYVLKELSKSKFSDDVVFKGGTSLSKAFKIVDRFSEDIDLVLLEKKGMNGNQIKKLLSDIEKKLLFHLWNLILCLNFLRGQKLEKQVINIQDILMIKILVMQSIH